MSGTIGRLIAIAVTLAGLAAATAIMWTQLNSAQSDIDSIDTNQRDQITSQVVCEAAGGTWTAGTSTCA